MFTLFKPGARFRRMNQKVCGEVGQDKPDACLVNVRN
jgi:hypothetical protein